MENEAVGEVTEGWLLKWTTYIKGYRKRYFVLENGLLSYYSQPEMKYIACRTTINLANALVVFPKHRAYFVLAEGSKRFYLKCLDETDKNHWKSAILLWKTNHKKGCGLNGDSDSMSEENTYSKVNRSSRTEEKPHSVYRITKKHKKKSYQRRSIDYVNDTVSQTSNQQMLDKPKYFNSTNGISTINNQHQNVVTSSSSTAVNSIHMTSPTTRKPTSTHWLGGLKMLNCMSSSRNHHHVNGRMKRTHGSEPSINRAIANSVDDICATDILDKLSKGNLSPSSNDFISDIAQEYDKDKLDLSNDTFQINQKGSKFQGEINHLFELIDAPTETLRSSFANVELANKSFVNSTSEILTRWSERIQKLQKRLIDELRHRETLERTIERLARQHTLLESQMLNNNSYSKNTINNNRITSPDDVITQHFSTQQLSNSKDFQFIDTRRNFSPSSGKSCCIDDISTADTFYDAQSFRESIISDGKFRKDCTKASQSSLDSMILGLSSDTATDSDENDDLERNLLATNKRLSDMKSQRTKIESFYLIGLVCFCRGANGIWFRDVPGCRLVVWFCLYYCKGAQWICMTFDFDRDPLVSDQVETLVPIFSSTQTDEGSSLKDVQIVESRNMIIHRKTIPHKPRYSLNLWSVLKNSIGKELTKLPLPVNFNEPLSVLQRATEDLIYSSLLDKAAEYGSNENIIMQMAYVAAFSVSSYAATANRTGKPFNPMLGETFECDRTMETNLGWRSMSEQVSHHPPIMAFYAESPKYKWYFRQDLMLTSKFRGKYLSVTPKGSVSLKFPEGNSYIWNKVTTTVHNIIVGSLWIDNHGEAEIINKRTGHICKLTYHSHSYFAKENRLILGTITNPSGDILYNIKGNWDKELIGWPVNDQQNVTLLWKAIPPRPDAEQIYNFNDMSIQLNELDDKVAPTDSRNRPDQRLMEEGHWDEANSVKEILEQNQRERRASWEKNDFSRGPPYSPLWFKKTHDSETNQDCYEFTGKYWENKKSGDWSECPVIFERNSRKSVKIIGRNSEFFK